MNNERNNSILHNSTISLNDVSTNRNSSTNPLRRSNTKTYDKREKILKQTKIITIKPKNENADEENKDIPKRIDVFGNPILKGERIKTYKVTFRDKTSSKPLIEIVTVTSYKRFYNDEHEEDKKANAKCNCGCSIF
jgi:hypothetical protein